MAVRLQDTGGTGLVRVVEGKLFEVKTLRLHS